MKTCDPTPAETRACDVLIIGGGPAGSTAATMLAERGFRVSLLEKAIHPRFHIGESLLPANLPLLQQLGVGEEVAAIGMYKPGAEFVSPWHQHISRFAFADAWDKSMPYAYQVKRADFDHILIRNAARKGVEVVQNCRARDVAFLPAGGGVQVLASHGDGRSTRWDARFLIDASGRDTFLGRKFDIKHKNPAHNSSAVFGHFANAQRDSGPCAGNIAIYWFEHGWFWFIPLADGSTSVGAVVWPYYLAARKKPVDEFLLDTIALCPKLAARLQQATLLAPAQATGNFAYRCAHCAGDNYLMIGDAFTFIDPVFSSGVLLAMRGGEMAAATVDTCLRRPRQAARARRQFERRMHFGPREFSWFIYRVTNPAMRELFMGPRNVLRMKEALLSLLAGDIYGNTPIWWSLRALKAVFYLNCLANPRRTLAALKQRRHNIQAAPIAEVGTGL